ncbi:hypothetical protein [Bdellovibrio sp. HCB337]|uniref:hypothetical protein n=1 Tax=Bdellovibrio sp. HCB337 TaxID=3394358 RepID=UPI0039A50FCF
MNSLKLAMMSLVFCLAAVTHEANASGGSSSSSLIVTAAFLSNGVTEFYAYGPTSKPNATITLNGVAVTKSDAYGSWNIQILNYTSPADCIARISDGASTVSKSIQYCIMGGSAGQVSLDGVSVVNAGSSGSMTLYTEIAAPATGVSVAISSGMPSVLGVPSSVFVSGGNTNAQVPFTTTSTSMRYQTVSMTAKSGSAIGTKNVLIVPSLASWNVTGAFNITAQGENYCSPYSARRSDFDAAIIATATDFMKNGESGTNGVNPGTERITVKTLNLRCAKSFPAGHQITATGSVVATNTSVTGGFRCFQAKQNWSCSAGTKNAMVSHTFAQASISYAVQKTITGKVCLMRAASAGGAVVSLVSLWPASVAVPASVTIPAGALCANYTASINMAGQSFGYDYDVKATYDGFSTWAKFVVNK